MEQSANACDGEGINIKFHKSIKNSNKSSEGFEVQEATWCGWWCGVVAGVVWGGVVAGVVWCGVVWLLQTY